MSREIASRDDLAQRQLEERLLFDLMRRVDGAVRDALRTIKCPDDPPSIFAILNGERAAPWPTRHDDRDRRLARQAMYARLYLDQTRRYVAVGSENPAGAAHAALMAGLHATAGVASSVLSAVGKKGGLVTGPLISEKAAANDPAIKRYYRAWRSSDSLQETYRSPVTYIRDKTDLARKTIERRLTILVPDWSRKLRQ